MPAQDPVAEARAVFPLTVHNAGGALLVHLAAYCVDAFPPRGRVLVLLVSRPGPNRAELVVVPAGDDAAAGRWLYGPGGIGGDGAAAIVAAAGRMESYFQRQAQRAVLDPGGR